MPRASAGGNEVGEGEAGGVGAAGAAREPDAHGVRESREGARGVGAAGMTRERGGEGGASGAAVGRAGAGPAGARAENWRDRVGDAGTARSGAPGQDSVAAALAGGTAVGDAGAAGAQGARATEWTADGAGGSEALVDQPSDTEVVGGEMPTDVRLAMALTRWDLPDTLVPSLRRLLDLLVSSAAPTAIRDRSVALDVHLRDSLAGLQVDELRRARRVGDLGSGAGLPGLPLALALPEADVLLVESQRRRCVFLARAARELELSNVTVACARAEELTARGALDAVTARALAALPVLCEYAAPLLRIGGVLVAWKGAVDSAEEADGAAAAAILGLEPAGGLSVTPYPGSERRTLHVFRKVSPTPATYPRRAGMAAKRPLRAGRRSPAARGL